MAQRTSKSQHTPAARTAPNTGSVPTQPGFWKRLRNGELFMPVQNIWRAENVRFVIGILVLFSSILLLFSFASNIVTGRADQGGVQDGSITHAENFAGTLGAVVSNYFMDTCFGLAAFFIPLFFILVGIKLMGAYRIRLWKWFLNFTILMIWFSLFFSLITGWLPETWIDQMSFRLGGGHGDYTKTYLTTTLGPIGVWLVILIAAILYLVYLTSETITVIRRLMHPQDLLRKKKQTTEVPEDEVEEEETDDTEDDSDEEDSSDEEDDNEISSETEVEELPDGFTPQEEDPDQTCSLELDMDSPAASPQLQQPLSPTAATAPANQPIASNFTPLDIAETIVDDKAKGKTVEEVSAMEPYDPRKDLSHYKFPMLSLLKHYEENGKPTIDMSEQNTNKERIITVLRNFGVEISSIKATIGPTITLYEVTPAPGVRINKIRNLEDDIALSLSALGIRIIAPIPGKGTIGIEVPNKNPNIVSMESIINTKKFQESNYELPIALGKTITNEVFMVDLAKMPHLLVAGATGQGKSVGLNAIITSLLYKKHPSELKFVMVDPKKVEFSIYAPIENHFLAKIPDENLDPIITDVSKVIQTLKSLCQLMDSRYDLLKKAKVRNIKEYNAKFKARQLNPENGHEYMPYIVIIIDEFGDLIMTAGKEVELPIARIAQLARAVGMHMVIATQRPTTNIITGTIKANFPARMAFKVMSQIDSRTILDQSGANQLVGKGDMLFLAGNTPVRVQCAFVDTPEVEKINDYISSQQGYLSAFELPEPEMDESGPSNNDIDSSSLDPLFEEAARLIVIHQQGSTSLIQRKFAIGYNRAGRLMDQLEHFGVVGPTRGSKPREVLISDEVELDARLEALHSY